eukprot:388029-Prymnesium_polylepis.1
MHTRSTPDFVRIRVLAQTCGGGAATQPSRLRAAVFRSGPRGLPEGIGTAHGTAPLAAALWARGGA